MIHLLMVIIDDLECLPELLQAWRAIGVPGATILESAGAYRVESCSAGWGLAGWTASSSPGKCAGAP